MHEILKIKAPKAFRNFYDGNLTAAQILNGFAQALNNVTSTSTGQPAWTLDRQAYPAPGQPAAARQTSARATYTYGNSNWALRLDIVVVPATPDGSALLLIFTDPLGWENGQSEVLVDITMQALSYTLGTRWAQRGWRMYNGQWAFGHKFHAPVIDPQFADGDWRLPDGRTIPFQPPRPNLPENMFEDCAYSRYYFRHLWGAERDLVSTTLRECIMRNFEVVDETQHSDDWQSTTAMVTGENPPLHIRAAAYEKWDGVVATLSFALADGWGQHVLTPTIDAVLAELPQSAPELFPDGRGLEGPALLPHAQADIFRYWLTSMIFGKQIWGSNPDKMVYLLAPALEQHFIIDYAAGNQPGSHVFLGHAIRANNLRISGAFMPSQGGVLVGVSFADTQHWKDPAVKSVMKAVINTVDGALHGFQNGLALEQGLSMWTLRIEGIGGKAREALDAIREAVHIRWRCLDQTQGGTEGQTLVLMGFLPGKVPVEMRLTANVQDDVVNAYLVLRQNEFELPSIVEETGNATLADIKKVTSRVSPTLVFDPMYRPTLDEMLNIPW